MLSSEVWNEIQTQNQQTEHCNNGEEEKAPANTKEDKEMRNAIASGGPGAPITTDSSGNSAGNTVKGGGRDLIVIDTDLPFGAAVTVTTALTSIVEFSPAGEAFGIQFDVATQNLDQFVIYGKFGSSGSYQVLYSTSAEYLAPTGALLMTSGNLTTVAATETGVFQMLSRGLYSVKLEAAAAVTGAEVTVYGAAQ